MFVRQPAPATGRVDRRKLRIADDHLMPGPLQVACDPFTFRGASSRMRTVDRPPSTRRRADPSFDEFTLFRPDTQLTLALLEIDPLGETAIGKDRPVCRTNWM